MPEEAITLKLRNLTSSELQRMNQDFAALTRAEQQAGREALRLAQSEAALKRSLGDTSGAVRVLSGALDQARVDAVQYSSAARQMVSANNEVGRGARSTVGALVDTTRAVVGLAVASRTISAGIELVQLGAAASQTATRFDQAARAAGTTGEAYTKALRVASDNTISDMNLQLAANRARLLGVADSAAQLAPLLGIARDRAQEMGISTTQAFGDLVTGLGRGSALILDNLGITVSVTEANKAYAAQIGKTVGALTEAEQKQALINAVLKQGKDSLDATGGAAETTATKIERVDASWQNLKATAGVKLADWFGPAIVGGERLLRGSEGLNEAFAANAANNKGAAAGMQAYTDALAAGKTETEAMAIGQQVAAQTASDYASRFVVAAATIREVAAATMQAASTSERLTGTMGGEIDAAIRANDAIRQNINALSEEATKKIDSQMAGAALAEEQRRLEADSMLAAVGMLAAGDQALALSLKYGIATEQAQFLINAQQQLTNRAALSDQRAGERSGGSVRSFGQSQTAADLARAKARRDEQEAARVAQARRGYEYAGLKTNAQRIAYLQQELAGTTDVAKRYELQAQILSLRNNVAKGHTSELGRQLDLSKSIVDTQRDAFDLAKAQIDDRRKTILEDQELQQARNQMANAKDPRIRALAQVRVDEIGIERQQRAAGLGRPGAAAPLVSLGGIPPGTGSAPPLAGGAPAQAPGGPGAPFAVVNVYMDSELIVTKVEPIILANARAGVAQLRAGGGGGTA